MKAGMTGKLKLNDPLRRFPRNQVQAEIAGQSSMGARLRFTTDEGSFELDANKLPGMDIDWNLDVGSRARGPTRESATAAVRVDAAAPASRADDGGGTPASAAADCLAVRPRAVRPGQAARTASRSSRTGTRAASSGSTSSSTHVTWNGTWTA